MNESDRSRWVLEAARDLAPAILARAEHVTTETVAWAARHAVALSERLYDNAIVPPELRENP